MDWTKRTTRDTEAGMLRTIQYAGNPRCPHAKGFTQQVEETILAVTCEKCGREVRYESVPAKVAFPARAG